MASITEQRAIIKRLSDNPEWRKKVAKMPERQVQAIYLNLTPAKKRFLTAKVAMENREHSIYSAN